MNASHEWLSAFVPLDASPARLRDLLTAHTATVEDLVPLRADLAAIVVARVVEAARHPDSDHLWATKVDAGGEELLEVICGASNVTAGALYPFAPVGTTMPNGLKIERRKIRGLTSNGMLCSARELGLGESHEGILELDVLAAPGTPLLSAMPVGDTRLVLDVGANRPDLLSHLGLARELSAVTGKKWQLPDIPDLASAIPKARDVEREGSTAGVKVQVDGGTRTRRYMAAVVKGVAVGPSPEWLRRRLDAVGVRSINNVVDATNYVLHELGQPVHAFDLQRLGNLVAVRMARPGERITTLDGSVRELSAGAVVIANTDGAQAVAGVMGGRKSEVTDATRDLFIEVASFDPKFVRSARKAIGLSTDASYRFERGVDPHLAPLALDRVTRLILALAGGSLADAPIDVAGELPTQPDITVRMARVAQVLGSAISASDAKRYLEGAGFEPVSISAGELKVRVPSWRSDVFAEIDLVEEIARFHGYDNFPTEIRPFRPTTTFDDPLWIKADRIREAMVGLGLLETRPMPFVSGADDSHVRVTNPLSENEAHLRSSVLESLSRRAEFNLSHRNGDIRLFEVGSVFLATGSGVPHEEVRLGIIVMGRRRPPHFSEPQPPMFDEWDARWIAEVAARLVSAHQAIELAPGSGGTLWEIRVGGRVLGGVSRVQLDAPVWAAPAFGIEMLVDEMESSPPAARGRNAYKEGKGNANVTPGTGELTITGDAPTVTVSKFAKLPVMPSTEIDLALLVPTGASVADVEGVIRLAAGELLEKLELFDQYTGPGVDDRHRSLAWRLTFRHPDRTLRDKEIEGRRTKILSALKEELNVRQRSA